jgi:phosphatidylserine/phosphatidylglycerophosphate/cardiolipin synthase-like enzyme
MRYQLVAASILFVWTILHPFGSYSQQVSAAQYCETLFTSVSKIQNGQDDFKLLGRTIELIDATPKGEEITVCVFKFSYKKMTEALIRAKQRGVAVRIILNKGSTSNEVNQKNEKRLKEHFDDFYFIENDVSKKSIIHNKFILFSRTNVGGTFHNHIILQTSTNFQKKSANKLQDMVVFSDKEIYDGYMKYWFQILSHRNKENLPEFNYFNVKNTSETMQVYFYPKRKEGKKYGKDDIKKILKSIQNPENATIKFAHGKWDGERLDIIEELKELQSEGSNLAIITNKNINEGARDELKQFGNDLILLNNSINMHTKFLLIQDGNSKMVITGSHNITERSLRENFEVLIVFHSELLYDSYANYFADIIRIGTK